MPLTYATATSYTSPSFTPVRTVVCTTQAQFTSAIAGLTAGDYLDVRGVTFTGEVTIANINPSGFAEVHFDTACSHTGTSAGSNLPAFWIHTSSKIRFFGCDISNPGGVGILIYGHSSDIWWWNYKVHDCGSHGVAALTAFVSPSTDGNITNLDLKGEIYNCGLNTAFDPHAEKGTGLHGMLLADAGQGTLSNFRVANDVHDQATGAGIELGEPNNSTISNGTIYMRAVNLTKVATSQVAGNALQIWGSNPFTSIDVPYLEATNLQGRAVDTNGATSNNLSGITIDYGRATDCCKNTFLGSTENGVIPSQPWDTRGNVTYVDIASTTTTGSAPANTALPVVTTSNPPKVGDVISTSNGIWSNTPTSFSYSWGRSGTQITNAVASTYTVGAADVGNTLTSSVTATNTTGSTVATSAATGVVVASGSSGGGTTGGGSGPGGAMALLMDGSFELGPAYQPFAGVEAANYGQVNTTHATFGNWFRDSTIVHRGQFSGRSDLLGNTTAPYERAECHIPRTVVVGLDDYYSLAYYFDPTYNGGPSGTIINQLMWQNLGPGGPTLAFRAHTDHIETVLASGATQATSPAYQYNSNNNVTIADALPASIGFTKGVWHEFIVHVHWAVDTTGVIEIWHREQGQTNFVKTVNMQPGTAATLQYNKGVPLSSTNPPTGGQDKIGPYRPSQSYPTSFWYDTFSRSTTFGDALLDLGGSVDTIPPVIQGATVTGNIVSLNYNEALKTNAPNATQFVVNVNGSPSTITNTSAAGSIISLTLSAAPALTDVVTVSYTPGA